MYLHERTIPSVVVRSMLKPKPVAIEKRIAKARRRVFRKGCRWFERDVSLAEAIICHYQAVPQKWIGALVSSDDVSDERRINSVWSSLQKCEYSLVSPETSYDADVIQSWALAPEPDAAGEVFNVNMGVVVQIFVPFDFNSPSRPVRSVGMDGVAWPQSSIDTAVIDLQLMGILD